MNKNNFNLQGEWRSGLKFEGCRYQAKPAKINKGCKGPASCLCQATAGPHRALAIRYSRPLIGCLLID